MTIKATPEAVEDDFMNPHVGRLQNTLSEAQVAGDRIALLLVHSTAIDRIDALHGFHAGDTLSGSIANLLRSKALRKHDSIETLSRDEFACILRPVSSEGVAILAAQRVLTLLATPFEFGGNSILADVAVGIAMFPEHGRNAEGLLQRAKQALLSARGHRDRLWMYETQRTSPPIDQLQYETRLRLALDQNSLILHFQPQADLRTGRLAAAEALLRWNDDILGSVPPNITVQVAESSGLIDRLSSWVITSAVQWCAEFQMIDPEFSISVNISPSNLQETDLPYYIDRALRTWGVASRSFTVEITETAMMIDPNIAHEALRELKSHGVRLSIDDFGTGYSSMYYLAQLPLDELKIDLMFVKGMLEVPHYAKIVRSLIELAHNLELTVVAEGVENEPVMRALAHLGCDYAQGYYLGKPTTAEDLMILLRKQEGSG